MRRASALLIFFFTLPYTDSMGPMKHLRCSIAVLLASLASLACAHPTYAQQARPASSSQPSSASSTTAPPTAAADQLAAVQKLIATGQDTRALEQLDPLISTSEASAAAFRLQGDALYDLNRLPQADAAYARALQADPHDQAAAQMRGLTLFRLGRPKDAIPLLEVNHAFGAQTRADPTYVLALCYLDALRYDDARRAFAEQYGMPPNSAAAYLLAARMLLRRGYVPIAEQYAQKAVTLDDRLPLAHQLLGEIALAQNQPDLAVSEFEKERLANPLQPTTYERLGDAYSRLNQYEKADRVLQQAVLLEPNATGPYILLGKVLLKQGQPMGAMTFLQKAETMDPANYMTHNLLAQAYRALGRSADASRELELTEKVQAADTPKLQGQP